MRTCFDTTNPANIPASGFDLLGGYDDGSYNDIQALKVAHPGKTVISISVFPRDNFGSVLDVEKGDADPDQAPGWVTMRREAGEPNPGVYCSLAAWPAVRAAFAAAKVPEPWYWIAAHPGNGANLYSGSLGHQYEDYRDLYDISVMADYIPGIDPEPLPSPNQTKGEDMIISTPTGLGYWVVKPDGSVYAYGDAVYLGGVNPGTPTPLPAGHVVTGVASHPTEQGYWLTSDFAGVYAFGAAKYLGSPNAA